MSDLALERPDRGACGALAGLGAAPRQVEMRQGGETLHMPVARGLSGALPRGADASWLMSHVNEMQMVLHSSAINEARAARGAPPVNGIWPWGGGAAPRVPRARWRHVWSSDPLVAGLAMAGGCPHSSEPEAPCTTP